MNVRLLKITEFSLSIGPELVVIDSSVSKSTDEIVILKETT